MYDSLLAKTKALTGATTVKSDGILVNRTPVDRALVARVVYPQNPTGTSPSCVCVLQHSDDDVDANYVEFAKVHAASVGTTGFPKIRRVRFNTQKKYVRAVWTLNNLDNDYGTVKFEISSGDTHRES